MSGPDRRPFICEECGQSFTRSSSLDRHVRGRHDPNFRGYPCPEPECFYVAKQKINLKAHRACKHEKAKPFKCPILGCDLSHASEKESARHVKRQHERKVVRGGSAASTQSSISSLSSSTPPQTPPTTAPPPPAVSQSIEAGTSTDISYDPVRNTAVDFAGPTGSWQTTTTDNVSIAQDSFSQSSYSHAIQRYNTHYPMYGDPSFETASWSNVPADPEFFNWF